MFNKQNVGFQMISFAEVKVEEALLTSVFRGRSNFSRTIFVMIADVRESSCNFTAYISFQACLPLKVRAQFEV